MMPSRQGRYAATGGYGFDPWSASHRITPIQTHSVGTVTSLARSTSAAMSRASLAEADAQLLPRGMRRRARRERAGDESVDPTRDAPRFRLDGDAELDSSRGVTRMAWSQVQWADDNAVVDPQIKCAAWSA